MYASRLIGHVCLAGLFAAVVLVDGRQAIAANSATVIANPDAYVCNQPGFIGFESIADGTNLSESPIQGVQFTTTDGFTWLVGDFATGTYNGKYPVGGVFMSQGMRWAWLGPDQGAGRIDFVDGNASVFSLLTSVGQTDVFLEAYDSSDVLLETAGPAPANAATGTMTELKIARPGNDIAYVIVHDEGNFFLVDSLCTDAPGVTEGGPAVVGAPLFGGKSGAMLAVGLGLIGILLLSRRGDEIDFRV